MIARRRPRKDHRVALELTQRRKGYLLENSVEIPVGVEFWMRFSRKSEKSVGDAGNNVPTISRE
jgi:hypothetical protein